jgi:hypothetical protein
MTDHPTPPEPNRERETANQDGVFRGAVGRTIRGFYRASSASGLRSDACLVLDDGTAIVFGSTGAYWTLSAGDVQKDISRLREKHEAAVRDLARAVEIAEGKP